MQKWPNILLVAGTNRNVGKTTFACKIISKFAQQYNVWAIKITPHIHLACPSCKTLLQSNDLIISEESSPDNEKDSSKMLAAGAYKVIYIQGADLKLEQILNWMNNNVPKNVPVVCESAALRKVLIPGKLVLLSTSELDSKHQLLIPLADNHFFNFQYCLDDVHFTGQKWL